MIRIEHTPIEGLAIITPRIFSDERGYFFESYSEVAFAELGITARFLQDNESCSAKDVLRGLHFQAPPYEQGKLVRVIRGSVLDVAVDIRKNSSTYGQHVKVKLDAESKRMFWIPPGFAHGFLSLEEGTIFSYKCTNVYHKESEGAVRWDDEELGIDWGMKRPLVSPKDKEAESFRELNSPF